MRLSLISWNPAFVLRFIHDYIRSTVSLIFALIFHKEEEKEIEICFCFQTISVAQDSWMLSVSTLHPAGQNFSTIFPESNEVNSTTLKVNFIQSSWLLFALAWNHISWMFSSDCIWFCSDLSRFPIIYRSELFAVFCDFAMLIVRSKSSEVSPAVSRVGAENGGEKSKAETHRSRVNKRPDKLGREEDI